MKARVRRVPASAGSDPRPHARAVLAARLRERRGEIEDAVLARAYGVADPGAVPDPEYLHGLRAAVAAAIDYGLDGVEDTGIAQRPVPPTLLVQARIAARNQIPLDTVLRRYSAGHTLLAAALLDEAAAIGIADLKAALGALAAHYERIVATVCEEYAREADSLNHDAEARRCQVLRGLLNGEPLDASSLRYSLEGWHLAFHARGPAREGLLALAERLNCRVLFAEPEPGTSWAWLGSSRRFGNEDFGLIDRHRWPESVRLAVGEPAAGAAGWRLGHHQAAAALPVARRSSETLVHYADVALLATALQDNLLTTWLRRRYLLPLESAPDGGTAAKATLRAYFRAARNVSSAAAALGVSRRTAGTRLSRVEALLGLTLDTAAIELDIALRLDELSGVQHGNH